VSRSFHGAHQNLLGNINAIDLPQGLPYPRNRTWLIMKKNEAKVSQKVPAPRFGIAEWYGQSFTSMTPAERLATAKYTPGVRLSPFDRQRLKELQDRNEAQLTEKERKKLQELRAKKERELQTNKRCPFNGRDSDAVCTKPGGICSFRLYENTVEGAVPVPTSRGGHIRAACPARFYEDLRIFKWVGERFLNDPEPLLIGEVPFLKAVLAQGDQTESEGSTILESDVDARNGEESEQKRRSAGRIDMVLMESSTAPASPKRWCAVEVQAVYFSGGSMAAELSALVAAGGKAVFPAKQRRMDYRSSAAKRLMPQLQTKVPTLRRWGKKMVVVVDRAFFNSLGRMRQVGDVSNCDIAWFVVDFAEDPRALTVEIREAALHMTTLEQAVEGLTAGEPLALAMFEAVLEAKSKGPKISGFVDLEVA
jgi:hypothetical protein